MSANVTVHHSVPGDPRYVYLGVLLGCNHFEAIGRMVVLWGVCTHLNTSTPPRGRIIACLGEKGPDALIAAELGALTEAGEVRVKGCDGRIDWLDQKRAAASKGGLAKAARKLPAGSQKASKPLAHGSPPAAEKASESYHPLTFGLPSGTQGLRDPVTQISSDPISSDPTRSESQTRAREARDTGTGTWATEARRELADRLWAALAEMRQALSSEFGLEVRPLHPMDNGRRELQARLLESGPERAEVDGQHVLAVVEAEARASGSVEWVSGSAFGKSSWDRKLAMTVADAAKTRGVRQALPGAAIGSASPRTDHPDGTLVPFGDAT